MVTLERLGDELPWIAGSAALLIAVGAEILHARRVRIVGPLAFGPTRRPAPWARLAPALRVASLGGIAWALATLFVLPPAVHTTGGGSQRAGPPDHVLLVLDVSPSMRLEDAGPQKDRSRMARAREVMESFFSRIPIERYRVSVVAVYNGALPVVEDTADLDVIHNILGDLPMHYAFQPGSTHLFDGLVAAFEMARPWNPGSTTLVVLTDGDTVPSSGMPRKPASIGDTVVVGVGDPVTGKFIDGRQSRQDVSTLRQLALRLGGHYHNGNEKHLPSALVASIVAAGDERSFDRLTRREFALITSSIAAALLALLPWALRGWGTRWNPGVPLARPRIATMSRRTPQPLLEAAAVPSHLARRAGLGKESP